MVVIMIVSTELKKMFQQLVQDDVARIKVDGTDVLVRSFDHASKLFLSAPVYLGSNFIPRSVRKCASEKAPFARNDQVKTYLTIDEEQFQVLLNYVGKMDSVQNESFIHLLEEFSSLADKWRLYLDENDRNDLVYVRIPR